MCIHHVVGIRVFCYSVGQRDDQQRDPLAGRFLASFHRVRHFHSRLGDRIAILTAADHQQSTAAVSATHRKTGGVDQPVWKLSLLDVRSQFVRH